MSDSGNAAQQAQNALNAGDVPGYIHGIRRALRLPDSDTMPTLADIAAGEADHTATTAAILLNDHAQLHTLTDFRSTWYENGPVHDRDLPWLVWTLFDGGCFTPQGLHEAVEWGWTKPEYPEANLSRARWVKMFRATGYLTDEGPAELPQDGVEVAWRGCVPTRRKGLAWTTDRDKAQWFADRISAEGNARVYEVRDVPASKVLARFNSRGESEVVVDTYRLPVTEP